jgi:hypothetical protein
MFELVGNSKIVTAHPFDDDEGMFEVIPQSKEGDWILR